MNIHLSTVNLEVTDVTRSTDFYTGLLGMELDDRRSNLPTFAYLRSRTCAITLTTPHEAAAPEPSRTMEIGFETDDLPAFKQLLKEKGVTDANAQSMGWGDGVELRDPDGYRVIVYAFRKG